MTDSTVAVRTALALYPGRYRRERGDELAVVFADTTAGAGPVAKARELFDLGAYGLRMRTGLTSASTGGRLAALAAPLVVGAVGGTAAVYAVLEYLDAPRGWQQVPRHLGALAFFLAHWALVGSAVLSAGAVLLGRWTVAKLLAGVTALAAIAAIVQPLTYPYARQPFWDVLFEFQWSGPFLLWSLVLLAAPKDALPVPTWRERGLVLAAAMLAPTVSISTNFSSSWHHLAAPWRALMIVVPLLMTLTAVRGWYLVAVPGLAALPWAFSVNLPALWQQEGGAWKLLPMAGLTVVVAVVLAVVGRRKGPSGPGGRQLA
ncbi:hypothetical protein [Kitasatospora cathayae]|uniref:Integral membrane protein n=1 Tax=Kitasatospora cathayae TaxID=3004092 RepID=A0ABY7Q460_9ACTN|nr:hypothetical protein [Kitasatospora sp. HUAS 3-15]WBP87490.1 hypothetical protein O1G21_17670 [Kitasatospora sp. HUAS 3-15]